MKSTVTCLVPVTGLRKYSTTEPYLQEHLYFLNAYECLPTCLYVHHLGALCPQRSKEGIKFPEAIVNTCGC